LTDPILIWGAGAIGGTLGAALARNGEDVIFVDNAADHVRAIQAKGLRIAGPIIIPTPLTERLIALIHDLETENRSFSRNNIDLLMTPERDNVK
jgi:ketopantoate reductase